MERIPSVLLGLAIIWLSLAIMPNQLRETLETSDSSVDERPGTNHKNISELFLVAGVIDGDTFEVWNGTEKQRVRYIGIDTPETYPEPSECFAQEATEYHRALLTGTSVRLERDISDTDAYGRWLRYVYLDNSFVNKELVINGFANAKMYQPDVARASELTEAEAVAQTEKRGLWATCVRE